MVARRLFLKEKAPKPMPPNRLETTMAHVKRVHFPEKGRLDINEGENGGENEQSDNENNS